LDPAKFSGDRRATDVSSYLLKYCAATYSPQMAEKIPGWLERVLLPQISELKGEIKATNAKIDGEFKVVHSEIRRLDQKIDGLGQNLGQRTDGVDQRAAASGQSLTQRIDGLDQKISNVDKSLGEKT
jgi:hypothetical protein